MHTVLDQNMPVCFPLSLSDRNRAANATTTHEPAHILVIAIKKTVLNELSSSSSSSLESVLPVVPVVPAVVLVPGLPEVVLITKPQGLPC